MMNLLLFYSCSDDSNSLKPHFRKISLTLSQTTGQEVLKYPGLPMMGYNTMIIDNDNNHLYFYDSQGEFPFYALDLGTLKLQGFGTWGGGPGELQRGVPVVISFIKSELIIYLPLEMRILIFTNNLEFKKETGAQNVFQPMSNFYLISDTLGVYISTFSRADALSFAQAYRVNLTGEFSEFSQTSIRYGEYEKNPPLMPLKYNPMLKLGPIHRDREGKIYWAHYYSSLRMGFSVEGEPIFITFEPRKVQIPEAKIKDTGDVITGDPEKSTQSYLSLTSDDNYLYALYSGEELAQDKIIAYRTGKSNVEIHLGEGKTVDVFNKQNGFYQFSFELPVWATNIAVNEHSLFVTTIEDKPALLIFNKPEI
jgi:hypothetical protein